jgi:hypothetical protein
MVPLRATTPFGPEACVMKKFLPKVFLSLGVVVMAGSAFVGSASAQVPADATVCAAGVLQTNAGTVPATDQEPTIVQCNVTIPTLPATAPVGVAPIPTAPTTLAPAPASPAALAPTRAAAAPVVQTASRAPIITTSATSGLAFTGADIWQSVVLGLVLIGGGVFFVRLGRRGRSAS